MTILALDTSVASFIKNDKLFDSKGPVSPRRAVRLPRINLRKRPCAPMQDSEKTNLVSVNSAFLSGLFSDISKVSEDNKPAEISPSEPEEFQPVKKTRISKTKSLSRCGRSYKIIGEAAHESCDSPIATSTSFFNKASEEAIDRNDSLHFQLHHVSSSTDASSANAVASLAFPQLPATVSNSSCATTLTRVLSDLQSSATENSAEEKYGWFVEMEDETKNNSNIPLAASDPYASSSNKDLAFSALLAPKADNHDAEIEWAKAADTVDDVLGDFF